MDDTERHWMEYRQGKYRKLFGNENYEGRGGIFVKKRRQQLLGLLAKSGGRGSKKEGDRKTVANFDYDVRETVKTALLDLQLFIETSKDKDVDQVMNHKALREVVSQLLTHETPERYKVAQMFAEEGLKYFYKSQNATQQQIDDIEAIVETTKQLTKLEIPKEEHVEYLTMRRNPYQ
jgi:hypothetical protein